MKIFLLQTGTITGAPERNFQFQTKAEAEAKAEELMGQEDTWVHIIELNTEAASGTEPTPYMGWINEAGKIYPC